MHRPSGESAQQSASLVVVHCLGQAKSRSLALHLLTVTQPHVPVLSSIVQLSLTAPAVARQQSASACAVQNEGPSASEILASHAGLSRQKQPGGPPGTGRISIERRGLEGCF